LAIANSLLFIVDCEDEGVLILPIPFIFDIEEVDERTARLRHRVKPDDLRPGGTVSGPTMFSLADAALFIAILGAVGNEALAVTTNMNINFLNKPSADNDLLADCRLIKVGKKLVIGEVTIYSETVDSPVAHAVGTYSIPSKTPR